jgi:hypothetical protein
MLNFITLLICIPVLLFCGAMFGFGYMKDPEPGDKQAWITWILIAVLATIGLAGVMYK